MAKITQKYAQSYDGAKIFYEVCRNNNSACLVFLHGLGGSLTAWAPEVRHFHSKGISTIAVDLLGHGNSDRPHDSDRYGFANQAKDIVAVLANEKFGNYILVGHCYGGLVAMVAESHHSKISKGLVVIDSTDYLPRYAKSILEKKSTIALLAFLQKYFPNMYLSGRTKFRKYKGKGDWYIPRLLQDLMHTSLKSYLFSFQNVIGLDIRGVIKNITVPTLVVASEKDSIFPPELSKDIATRIKSSILTILPGENHVVVLNNPKIINDEIDSFLKVMKVHVD